MVFWGVGQSSQHIIFIIFGNLKIQIMLYHLSMNQFQLFLLHWVFWNFSGIYFGLKEFDVNQITESIPTPFRWS